MLCIKTLILGNPGATSRDVSLISKESRLAQAVASKYLSVGLSVWFTTQTERVIVLSKILTLNNSLALLLSVLLAASVGTIITIEKYRRISCHDNFVKAKDASSRVRDRSWNVTFCLDIFCVGFPHT